MRLVRGIVLVLLALLALAAALLYTPDTDLKTMRAKYANAASEFIPLSNGQHVHVRDEGDKTRLPIVLLHGSNSSLQTWEPWVSRLKNDYRVITLDLPGHGLTGPHPGGDYSDDAFAAAVDGVVSAKHIDRFVLGGNSMGGWVAWEYALRHPDKLAGLVLVDAAGAPPPPGPKSNLPIGFRIARTPILRDLMLKLTPRATIEQSLRQSVSVQSIITPVMVDRYWELLRYPGNRQATIDRFAHRLEGRDFDKLANLTIPTLILWGREDKLIPVATAAEFAAKLPHSKTILYEHVGHIPMEEVAEQSGADLVAWLKSLSGQEGERQE